jgi:hypothetical protein
LKRHGPVNHYFIKENDFNQNRVETMKQENQNISQEIYERIEYIKNNIQSHKRNIKLLHYFSRRVIQIKANPYVPRIVKYSCIPRSDKRLIWTLENITNQVILLERELETLIKYGVRSNRYERESG